MRLFFIFFICIFYSFTGVAEPYRQRISESFTIDTYTGDTLNLNQLLGYYLTFDFTSNVGFHVGSSWAITGQYGGYGTVSFGPQFFIPVSTSLSLVLTPMIGVGGHAALPLGNGLLFWSHVGLNYKFNNSISLLFNYGAMNYVNRLYKVSTICIGVQHSYDIFLKK